MQTLDVAADERLDADAADEAVQVHLHARLVAVAGAVDHPGRAGAVSEQRSDRAVQLGVHQDDVGAGPDGVQHHSGGVLDGASDLDQHLHRIAGGQDGGVIGDHRVAGCDGTVDLGDR